MSTPSIQLFNGHQFPTLGLGTFLSAKGEVATAVKHAIKIGYRHIDCAFIYKNEAEIGTALSEVFAEGSVKREELFVTSKLFASQLRPEGIEACAKKTLADLQLDYLDLYLVHIPIFVDIDENDKRKYVSRRGFGMHQVWAEMEKLVDSGLVKSIGVSNMNVQLLFDLLGYCRIQPAVNQVERTPYFQQKELLDFCRAENIVLTAYSPLGAPGLKAIRPTHGEGKTPLLSNEQVATIAKKHNKTIAQVLIRFQIECGVVTIPKSTKKTRIEENFDVFDFKLEEADMKVLNALEAGFRLFRFDWTGIGNIFA